MNPEETGLYHYTSFEALDSILRHGEIWLGNLRSVNDNSEMLFFFQKLEENIIADLPDLSSEIESLFQYQLNRFTSSTSYVFSLTTLLDDAAQWERYSNAGKGVCIKFDRNLLSEALSKKAVLQKVFYVNEVRNHQLLALIELYLTKKIISYGYKTIDEVFENAWACSIAFKHPSFNSEHEIRICAEPFPELFYKGDYRYKTAYTGLREFLPLSIKLNNGKIAIEEIIIGPKADVDKNVFLRYLSSIGFDDTKIKIRESECPLK